MTNPSNSVFTKFAFASMYSLSRGYRKKEKDRQDNLLCFLR